MILRDYFYYQNLFFICVQFFLETGFEIPKNYHSEFKLPRIYSFETNEKLIKKITFDEIL